jgi:hypothetical protein
MAKTKAEIITDIANYVRDCGGKFSQWYIGIAADAEDRLFNGHAVNRNGDAWIYRLSASSTVARKVEDHFVAKGMNGGPAAAIRRPSTSTPIEKRRRQNPDPHRRAE